MVNKRALPGDRVIPEQARPGRGRSRSKEAELAVLDAAFILLSQKGLQATTIEAIAAQARVSKATIYKWWPNRAAIIMSAYLRESFSAYGYPPDFDQDAVTEKIKEMCDQFSGPIGAMLSALIADGQSDERTADEFRKTYVERRRLDGLKLVKASIDEGVIRRFDPHVILDVLYAPLYYRLLVKHQPLTHEFVTDYVELVMNGIAAKKPAIKSAPKAAKTAVKKTAPKVVKKTVTKQRKPRQA